jgi:hypothetical protein
MSMRILTAVERFIVLSIARFNLINHPAFVGKHCGSASGGRSDNSGSS